MSKVERVFKEKIVSPCPLCRKPIKGNSKKHWKVNCFIHLHLSSKHKLPFDEAKKIVDGYFSK